MIKYKLINNPNIEAVRREIIINFKNGFKSAVIAKDNEFNRKMIETNKLDLFILDYRQLKENKLKQRSAVLNQVLCKIAKKNDLVIGIDLSNILYKNEIITAINLSKFIQDINLCKKYDVKIELVNCTKNRYDVFSLLLSLGLPTDQSKYAVDNIIFF